MTTHRQPPARDDAGVASVVLVLLTGAFLALAGLVWDGGRAITAREQAANLAEQAARAGAEILDITAARATGTDTIDTAAAADAAACRYVHLTDPTATCAATATATTVTVAVTTHTSTAVLGIVGVNSLTTHGHATATPVRGVVTPIGSSSP
jgi:Flp pilus assembly protein TadG